MGIRNAVVGAVAVLALGVSSVSAAWDYFPVVEAGKGEAQVSYEGGLDAKVRFGLMENLELYGLTGANGVASDFILGGRYQVVPEMLGISVGIGLPRPGGTMTNGHDEISLIPGVTFSTAFTDMISLGAGLEFGLGLNTWEGPAVDDNTMSMHLSFGLELDFALSDNTTLWVGSDFTVNNLHADEADDLAIFPALGVTFSATENLDIGFSLGIDLDSTNREGDESAAIRGGFDFTVKF